MWRVGLVAPWHVGSSWTRARTSVPCIGRRLLNHCTTREAPQHVFLNKVLLAHYTHSLTYCVWLVLHISDKVGKFQQRPSGLQGLKYLLALYRKFADPCYLAKNNLSNERHTTGDFPGSPAVRTVPPPQGEWVRSLVGELRFPHATRSTEKGRKEGKEERKKD